MDEGPFRMPQRPTERSAHDSPAEAKQSEEPKPAAGEPKPVHRKNESHRGMKVEKSKKPLILSIVAAVVVVLIVVGGWLFVSNLSNSGGGIDGSKYQAVFFTNGQVYFGKLQSLTGDYLKMTDIFYLQTQPDASNPQKTSGDTKSDNMQLVKLGGEVHGPEDEMIIAKGQILFVENLKSDGKVAQSISNYQQNKK